MVFKTVDGAFVDPADRRSGAVRASPNGYHRHSMGPTQIMSAYCKQREKLAPSLFPGLGTETYMY